MPPKKSNLKKPGSTGLGVPPRPRGQQPNQQASDPYHQQVRINKFLYDKYNFFPEYASRSNSDNEPTSKSWRYDG